MDHLTSGRRAARRPADAVAAHRRRAVRRQRRGRRPRRPARRRRRSRSRPTPPRRCATPRPASPRTAEVAETDATAGEGTAPRIDRGPDDQRSTSADRRISVQRIGARPLHRLPPRPPGRRGRPAAARRRRQRVVRPSGRARDRAGRRRTSPRRPGHAGRLRRRAASPPPRSPPAALLATPSSSTRSSPPAPRRPRCPRSPSTTRVLSLEDRADPVALLGSLINAGVANRLTVVFDGADARAPQPYVAGGRAADAAQHPELRGRDRADPGARLPRRLSARSQRMSCDELARAG